MQQVKFVAGNLISNTRYYGDKYAFRKDKKWHRLQRLCFWALKKIGAYAWYDDSHMEYTTVEYEPYKIADYIHQQWREQQRLYYTKPRYLFLGRDQFYQLTRSTVNYPMMFSINVQDPSLKEYMGMEIVIIPWMDGTLVVPDFGETKMNVIIDGVKYVPA